MTKSVIIRIDVDSVEGIRNAIPFYLKELGKHNFQASFFIPLGQNNVLKAALWRIWRPSFWKQSFYMKPWKTYTWFDKDVDKTGDIGAGHPEVLRMIEEHGHEIALHGYDHATISDNAYSMSAVDYRKQIDMACEAYRDILGHDPAGTGSPGRRYNQVFADVQDPMEFLYASDVGGPEPCQVRVGDRVSSTIQVPVNIESVFSIVVRNRGNHKKSLDDLISQIEACDDFLCLLLHTEYDYVHFRDHLRDLFTHMADNGYKGIRCDHYAEQLKAEDLPIKEVKYGQWDGAVGPIAYTD
ncbi:MAG: polysaccharide deacetylase family protein [Alphaproteobacteria bacterium]|nr:polysaccharide deacetylase family protein [Alphaproteobacteria bacterium]